MSPMTKIQKRAAEKVSAGYEKANRLLWGAPGFLKAAITGFTQVRAAQAAAGIAYYALFSIFPMLLLFIVGGSSVLDPDHVERLVIRYIGQALPVPTDVLQENLERAMEARGPIGLTGFIGLAWAATGVFSALENNVSRAWTGARERNFFMTRLVGTLMLLVLVILLIASLIVRALILVFIMYRDTWDISVSVVEANFWRLVSLGVSLALVYLMFLAMYRFVPSTRAQWRAAFWGAAAASTLSYLATRLFSWYIDVGVANYELVYGSLGAIVALMFLFYILAVVTLFGAHLTASIDTRQHLVPPQDEEFPSDAPGPETGPKIE